MPTVHLEFGGSTAARTSKCPGWHTLARTLPASTGSSDAAALGTALHTIMDECMMNGALYASFIGTDVEGVRITQAHIDNKIVPAMEAMKTLIKQYDIGSYEGEVPVALANCDDVGGTADFVGLSKDGKTVLKVDYKFGDGFMVSAVENDQLMQYLACLHATEGWREDLAVAEKYVVAIVQPVPTRAGHETINVWEVPGDRLVSWTQEYMQSVDKARGAMRAFKSDGTLPPEALLNAGSHCTFCPAQAICPAKTGLFEKARRLNPAVINDLAAALTLTDEIDAWIKSVRKLAFEQMDRGDNLPGFKLVPKRGTRKWSDHEAVEELVRKKRSIKKEEAYTHTLLSPAQMEQLFISKKLDAKQLAAHYAIVSSGTTIAPESDPRPAALRLGALKALAGQLT